MRIWLCVLEQRFHLSGQPYYCQGHPLENWDSTATPNGCGWVQFERVL